MRTDRKPLYRPGYFLDRLGRIHHRFSTDGSAVLIAPEWVTAFKQAYTYAQVYWQLLGGTQWTSVAVNLRQPDEMPDAEWCEVLDVLFPNLRMQAAVRIPLRLAAKKAWNGGEATIPKLKLRLVFPPPKPEECEHGGPGNSIRRFVRGLVPREISG